MKHLLLLTIIILLIAACEPMPIDPATPTPPVKPTETMAIILPLNSNPGLTLAGCMPRYFDDGFWGLVSVAQCWPADYELYQIWQKADGDTDNHEDFITTNPMAVTAESGLSYTVYPGGRAGRIGFTSAPIEIEPGCYAVKMFGEALLWGKPLEYSVGALIGDDELYNKQTPAYGSFEVALFWLANTRTVAPVTWFLQFDYGSADSKSRVNISRLEVLPVSIGHCG